MSEQSRCPKCSTKNLPWRNQCRKCFAVLWPYCRMCGADGSPIKKLAPIVRTTVRGKPFVVGPLYRFRCTECPWKWQESLTKWMRRWRPELAPKKRRIFDV